MAPGGRARRSTSSNSACTRIWISVGKAIGGGFPVGAALLSKRVAAAIAYGDHGTTYGGNLLACRAALFYLDQLEGGLLEHVRAAGAHFEAGLRSHGGAPRRRSRTSGAAA